MPKRPYQTIKGDYFLVPRKEPEGALLKTLEEMGVHLDLPTTIRILRGALSLSKQEFCKRAGITRTTLDRLESGRSKASKQTRLKLSKMFGPHFLAMDCFKK